MMHVIYVVWVCARVCLWVYVVCMCVCVCVCVLRVYVCEYANEPFRPHHTGGEEGDVGCVRGASGAEKTVNKVHELLVSDAVASKVRRG